MHPNTIVMIHFILKACEFEHVLAHGSNIFYCYCSIWPVKAFVYYSSDMCILLNCEKQPFYIQFTSCWQYLSEGQTRDYCKMFLYKIKYQYILVAANFWKDEIILMQCSKTWELFVFDIKQRERLINVPFSF